jgi:small subunit ribosomal protein S4
MDAARRSGAGSRGQAEKMARYTGPVCRLCRRERTKLFLKGERCYSLKCPVSEAVTDRHSRAYPPGEHGRDRMRQGSEYLSQLREKQKARRIYGVLEKQFRNMYEEANRQPGITGENLLRMLELRLDNVAFRAGWGASRSQARQLVRHGHVNVNGKRVTIPSYRVRVEDVVSLKASSRELFIVRRNLDTLDRQLPLWLDASDGRNQVRVASLPERQQIDETVRESLIVELYSK